MVGIKIIMWTKVISTQVYDGKNWGIFVYVEMLLYLILIT